APSPAETSLATDDGKSDSFCSNASSRSLASAATRLFLAGSARPAQVTAESADVRLATSARRLSRSAADWPASSTAAVLLLVLRSRALPAPPGGGPKPSCP